MNDEILAFLVGGRGDNVSPQRNAGQQLPSSTGRRSNTPSGSNSTPRQIKRVAESFHSTFQNDWIGTDDHALQIVRSIANLRERLWQGNKFLRLLKEEEDEHDGCGGLIPDDIVLMLDHDLIQHEKMMSQLRRSIAQLAQAQDAVGRRLDEWYKCCGGSDVEETSLETSTQLYKASGSELYRKQLLTQDICESGGSVGLIQEEKDAVENPRQIAKAICAKWPRESEASHLREYADVLRAHAS